MGIVTIYPDGSALREAVFARRFEYAVLLEVRDRFLCDLVREGFSVCKSGRDTWGFPESIIIAGNESTEAKVIEYAKKHSLIEYLRIEPSYK